MRETNSINQIVSITSWLHCSQTMVDGVFHCFKLLSTAIPVDQMENAEQDICDSMGQCQLSSCSPHSKQAVQHLRPTLRLSVQLSCSLRWGPWMTFSTECTWLFSRKACDWCTVGEVQGWLWLSLADADDVHILPSNLFFLFLQPSCRMCCIFDLSTDYLGKQYLCFYSC